MKIILKKKQQQKNTHTKKPITTKKKPKQSHIHKNIPNQAYSHFIYSDLTNSGDASKTYWWKDQTELDQVSNVTHYFFRQLGVLYKWQGTEFM